MLAHHLRLFGWRESKFVAMQLPVPFGGAVCTKTAGPDRVIREVAAKRKIDVVTSAITDVPLAEQRVRWSPTRRECAECGKADYEQERCLGVPLHRPDEN